MMNAHDISGKLWRMQASQVTDPPGQEALVEKARRDPEAFAQLYRRHYDEIFRYCIHRLLNRTAAEDITAATFLKVVQHFGRFRGDERSFRCWVFQIATNEINSQLRADCHRKELLERFTRDHMAQDGLASQPIANIPPLRWVRLQQALDSLKPRYQTIIALHFTEEMKLEEIAAVLGSSPGTVRSQLSRALRKLRKKLAGALKTEPTE